MNKHFVLMAVCAICNLSAMAQGEPGNEPPGGFSFNGRPPMGEPPGGRPPGGNQFSTAKPKGAAFKLSKNSKVSKNKKNISTSKADYNAVQVTNGTLNLSSCNIHKTGDTESRDGDATSFFGINSAVYASGNGAIINMSGGKIITDAKGCNAVFSTNGATVNVAGITIKNNSPISRGLHCTYGGIINAVNVDITTNGETSSSIATDRGGGTVTVSGGTSTANGFRSAVLYSTGTITANDLTGFSKQGEIGVVEGDNGIVINNCTMTSGSKERALMMLQSGSGDADGVNAYINVFNSKLAVSEKGTPLCEVPTLNNGTLTLTDVSLTVASGVLLTVDYNTQWRTHGGYGHLVLKTTKETWTYTGIVDADKYSHATVEVGENVTWEGAMDNDYNAASAIVTIKPGATWVLTGNSYVSELINDGTIKTNGYRLIATKQSGNGTLSAVQEVCCH